MTKNVVTKKTNGQVAQLASFDTFKSMGFESIDAQDYATPRLKVLMALSPEVADETVAGAKPGTVSYTHLTLPTKRIV